VRKIDYILLYLAMEHKKEIWKYIKGTNNNYSVSSLGKVKSNGFYDSLNRWKPSKILKGSDNANGYLSVSLGRNNRFYIHRLVASEFLSLKLDGELHVNHLDGIKSNNILDNLEIVTRSQNDLHKKRNLEWHRYPILDLETGIYYSNCKELHEIFSHLNNWSYGMLKSFVSGHRKKGENKRFLRI
jgi:hypothetical protein